VQRQRPASPGRRSAFSRMRPLLIVPRANDITISNSAEKHPHVSACAQLHCAYRTAPDVAQLDGRAPEFMPSKQHLPCMPSTFIDFMQGDKHLVWSPLLDAGSPTGSSVSSSVISPPSSPQVKCTSSLATVGPNVRCKTLGILRWCLTALLPPCLSVCTVEDRSRGCLRSVDQMQS